MNSQTPAQLIPVHIGMISFAHGHAYSYAAELQQIPGVEIVGIYDDDATRGTNAATRFNTRFFDDAAPLLDQELDGLVICSENANHAPLVQFAASRTRHILCEKPIATTVAAARAMIDTCRAHDTNLQIAFPVRFSAPIRQLKAMIASDDLGQVYAVKCTNHGKMPGGWFQDRELAGGGAVLDHTVHVIDLLRWLWQTEVTEVYAEVGTSVLHPHVAMDDVGLLSFTLANGIYGTLDTSWSRPSSYPAWGDLKLEVVAQRGVITVNATNQHLHVSSERWGKTQWVNWGTSTDAGLMADFVDMIRTDRPPTITGEDGLAALEVALAAYRSAERHQPIRLPLA